MKKLVLTTLVAVSFAAGAFAQGYVSWTATPGSSVIGVTNTTTYSGLSTNLGGGQATGLSQGNATGSTAVGSFFYYALLVNTTGTATTTPTTLAGLSGWTATGLYQTNNQSGNGRLVPIANPPGAVPSTGSAENFLLVGWSSNIVNGTNVSTVISDLNSWSTVGGTITGNAFFGISAVATVTPSTSSSGPTQLFASGLIFNPSTAPMELYLLAVPEPGTMALAALGGASLLLFRRRK
jgi:hypothetical protein